VPRVRRSTESSPALRGRDALNGAQLAAARRGAPQYSTGDVHRGMAVLICTYRTPRMGVCMQKRTLGPHGAFRGGPARWIITYPPPMDNREAKTERQAA
jgi:hypothetical protein